MTLDEIKFRNELVYQYTKGLITEEQCICGLVEIINEQRMEIIKLTQIAPFKIKTSDGSELIWRCPDNLIPERKK